MRIRFANTLNPIGFRLWDTMNDATIRYCIMQGGSSSGKSYSFAQVCLWQTTQDGENTLVLRKVGASISKTIYEDFRVNATRINDGLVAAGYSERFKIVQNRIIDLANGARIDFTGLDDSEKIKGISNYKRIFMDELTEFDYEDFRQIRTRMRGKVGQQLYAAFNPINEQHWIKRKLYDCEQWKTANKWKITLPNGEVIADRKRLELKGVYKNGDSAVMNPRTGKVERIKSNMLWICSTYLNNFWVVGSPNGKYGFYDVQCIANYEHDKEHDPDYYRIYALGEWGVIRTGGEFLPSFSMRNVEALKLDKSLPVHVSIDDNVLPYITATIWQYDAEERHIKQIGNVCARDPNNYATAAASMVCDWLRARYYGGDVFLHGDVTTKKANTIDPQRRSFFDMFKQGLETAHAVHDCTGTRNPSVALSGEFCDRILSGAMPYKITIDADCKESIDDYLAVKKDQNGAILKTRIKDSITKQSYEEHGHATDTMRYLVTDILRDEFTAWSLSRVHNTHTELNYIGAHEQGEQFTFIVPSFDNFAALLRVSIVGGRIVVEDAELAAEYDAAAFSARVHGVCVFEATKPFIDAGKRLREQHEQTRLLTAKGNADERIKATAELVREQCYFIDTQEPRYIDFVNNLLDYNGTASREAANVLALAVQFISRQK